MSTTTLKIIIIIVFIAHGLGYAMPILAAFGLKLNC